MAAYRLSRAADQDIENLFEYGIDNFGLLAAKLYLEGLVKRFDEIALNPLHYPAVDHIRIGYRRSVYATHSIYFKWNDEQVDIMRILRAENISTALGFD
ncbi:type II toxin-antitoxin system RelE/ParE family toxin [Psychrobium sp. MM17-31]|uniref:type II toxin-antitoxin system RelE/ParE family toxin n=1 Tax=Psychrobium sp. MM17-31 TaxID=2917758 RepID=UPI001EF4443E|nr:type II toxin-antitoxin system RelE/ParE family toxin [Psychrobium sp. MM17-31]MCG7532329.1 type II toxin-antitoxin system RelE/ParE family toxin [Psychrobium sp. MM17-31]